MITALLAIAIAAPLYAAAWIRRRARRARLGQRLAWHVLEVQRRERRNG